MGTAEKQARTTFITSTGREYKFEMAMEKAIMFSQHVSNCKPDGNKSWLDVWDYTGTANGQFLIDMNSIESILVETIDSEENNLEEQ